MKFFATQFASFRALQIRAKALGLKANGTKVALRERIARYYREGVFGLLVRVQRPQYRRAVVKFLSPATRWVGAQVSLAWANRGKIAAAVGSFLLEVICGVIAFALAIVHVAVLSYERIEDEHAAPYELPQLVAAVVNEEYIAPAVQDFKEAVIAAEPALGVTADAPVVRVMAALVKVRVTQLVSNVQRELTLIASLLAKREVVIPALNV